MNRLLIATTNPAKLSEYRILLRQMAIDLEPISLADAGITDIAEEDADSFRDNALAKARFYFERSKLPTLADDGGLEVDALGGAPGVRSHRWLGVESPTDRALAEEVIRRMEGVPKPQRTARIRAAIALIFRDGEAMREEVAEDAIEGLIAPRAFPEIRKGFPYRAVLWLPEQARYLGELGDEEEARISQRRKALLKLREHLLRLAGQSPNPLS
ncbi:MAG TPA: non-canonical purine NTP pyrophosphatase [Candidatus Binataceae bacterium]|nr:non-canonical purine NTP pyrophosphatase [Candidatus Binataceae bacterium]